MSQRIFCSPKMQPKFFLDLKRNSYQINDSSQPNFYRGQKLRPKTMHLYVIFGNFLKRSASGGQMTAVICGRKNLKSTQQEQNIVRKALVKKKWRKVEWQIFQSFLSETLNLNEPPIKSGGINVKRSSSLMKNGSQKCSTGTPLDF